MPPGSASAFEPRRDVDAVAVDVGALDDDVAEIDADAKLDAWSSGDTSVAVEHRLLHLDRAAHRIDDAGEFHQHAVAGRLDDPAGCSAIFGSTSSRRSALRRSSVPSSSAPISRE